ncbi:MAG: magnesium transporter [Hominilimicola sp.]
MLATISDTIETLLKNKKYSSLRDVLSTMNEADIAAMFSQIKEDSLPLLFRLLPKDLAADTFALMDTDGQELLIRGFSDNEIKEVFDELYVDDAADIVEEMPANVVKRILKNTDPEMRQMINEILKYPEDSAGSLMTTDYISLRPKMTVSDAIKRIRRTINEAETVYTCYVTDDNRKLLGYLSVKNLLLAQEDEKICDIMDKTIICVHTLADKEDVAKDMNKYDFVTMPVVDDEGRLVGIVTFDDAIDVMQDEATEDIERMAAISPTEESYFKTSDFKHAKNRILWLLILMLSAAITGGILTRYEEACSAIPLLVSFIPMLMSTGGNCGSQSSTMIIRGMSVDEIKLRDYFKVAFTELRISLIISVTLAVVNGVRIWIMEGDLKIAVVVSLSIIFIVIIAQFIGCTLPMLAKRCKLDPAVMAAPLITTIVDAASILVYFSIATRFFNL